MTWFKPVSSSPIHIAVSSTKDHNDRNHFGVKGGIALMALMLGGIFVSPPAQASICGDHKNIKKILGERYSESQRAFGMVNQDGLVEVYTSSGGSWSILMTSSNGRTCIIAAGKAWQEFEQAMLDPAA